MADKEQAVEIGAEAAGTTVVEKKEDEATASQGFNLADALEKTLERAEKAEKDRDNYKRGLLKAKGKTEEDEEEPDVEDLDTRIANGVARALADKETKDSTQQLLKRIKEMEKAFENKSQLSNAGVGTGTESQLKVGDNQLSDAQLADLKGRGWDDAKIARFKQNLLKVR
jgi:hypothetical protein